MKNVFIIFLLMTFVFSMNVPFARACTTFIIQDDNNLVFGRNLDWFVEEGLIIVNNRNVAKRAMIFPPDQPAEWVSQYGSITFNQVGKEFPYGGINEAGLVIENMVLGDCKFPVSDERQAVNEVQWIQYQLDNFATVEEVINSDKFLRVGQASTGLHYLICDKNGQAAVIEFLDGKMLSYTGDDLPIPTLTNSTYENSIDYVRGPKPDLTNFSLQRFEIAADMVKAYTPQKAVSPIDYAFEILGSASYEESSIPNTKWSIVYDVKNMEIYFKTLTHTEVKYFSLSDFDFDCQGSTLMINMALNTEGDISKLFVDYSTAANEALINETFDVFRRQGFLDIPDTTLFMLSRYPEEMECQE